MKYVKYLYNNRVIIDLVQHADISFDFAEINGSSENAICLHGEQLCQQFSYFMSSSSSHYLDIELCGRVSDKKDIDGCIHVYDLKGDEL